MPDACVTVAIIPEHAVKAVVTGTKIVGETPTAMFEPSTATSNTLAAVSERAAVTIEVLGTIEVKVEIEAGFAVVVDVLAEQVATSTVVETGSACVAA